MTSFDGETVWKGYQLKLVNDLLQADTQLVFLAALCIATAIVLDAVTAFVAHRKRSAGVSSKATPVSIDGSVYTETRQYISEAQQLSGRPDAVIAEGGFLIPVEVKPLARKIRDRYVAQLLVYMRLIEEFEQKRPPYGYLILGNNKRRVKIENSLERQEWLERYLKEMRAVLQGATAIPDPHPQKCRRCDVRERCRHRADTKINASSS